MTGGQSRVRATLHALPLWFSAGREGRESCAGVPVRGDISGNGTLLSIEKERAVLGFDPQHSWR